MATEAHGEVPAPDAVATYDKVLGRGAVFLVNRSIGDDQTVNIDLSRLGHEGAASQVHEAMIVHDDDPYARNTLQAHERVVPKPVRTSVDPSGQVIVTVPPVSWASIAFGTQPAQDG